jgi:hypothetical protein
MGKHFAFKKVLLDCGAQLELLGQSSFVGLGTMDEDLEPCPYQIQTLMGAFEKAYVFTKTNTSQPILWQFLEKGVCLLELFGGISTSLATMLQASIWFTNTCMRTPTWQLQGKVAHFLHHNLVCSIVACNTCY